MHLYITQGRNYDQFILMCHVHSAHKTDLGRVTVLLEASMGDQKMLHLFSLFQLRIKPLSNEHTGWLYWLETFWLMYLSMSALTLKKLSVGNMGDQKKLRIFSLSSYVQNNYLRVRLPKTDTLIRIYIR